MALRVTLLGFTVPDPVLREIMATDEIMSVQTHTFAWALVRSLRAAGCQVRLVSAAPVSTYPRNRRVVFRRARFRFDDVDGQLLGFVNLLGLKHLTRFVAAMRARPERADSDVLLIHGVHAPFLWCGAFVARRRGVHVVPVLTDPPGVALATDGAFVRLLRRIDVALVRAALRRCSGVVALTRPLADDFAPGLPCLVMEGICDPLPATPTVGDETPFREIVYAGGLTRAYGVDRLVRAFQELPDPDLRLALFGRGELADELCAQATRDPRVRPPQLIGRKELASRLARAAVLVNPRPVAQGFVRYSFPSKLLEYLAAGVPVVTTRLPGIPADYERHLMFAETDDGAGLREALARALALDADERRERGTAGATFARRERGPAAQGARLRQFLAGLAGFPGETPGGGPTAVTGARPPRG
ncbi:glycosyltransferase [Micromonospora sp. WMMD1128]|uniref:glycosyltransferase n=1 Tax=Micromonospora sp. WMMD1128 TaxID=3015150 RepID=UPI00248B9F42|nr:glycosyltransferase [Micromonospora sp. WMMD1128]WBB71731.1 glycosyltransferase [Micromonospora sp. WMMD1128]